MIKYVILLVELLLLSSCGYNMESENESNITKKMRSYISNNVEGSYGFFECNMVKEHIDSLCWKTDIYRIQQQIELYASQRRTIIANSYVPVQIDGWPFPNKFDLDFVSPQGYGKRIHESYITKEEREVCDYVYYKESVPEIRKRDNEDLFYICKLMYDYDMLRDFIQSTLNINLEDAKVKALIAKYKSKEDKEKLSSIWEVSTSTVSDKYGAIFRRLKKY